MKKAMVLLILIVALQGCTALEKALDYYNFTKEILVFDETQVQIENSDIE